MRLFNDKKLIQPTTDIYPSHIFKRKLQNLSHLHTRINKKGMHISFSILFTVYIESVNTKYVSRI